MNQDVEELGAKVLHQWATLGAFDFVNIVEAPDVETVAKVSVALGALLHSQSDTGLRVGVFLSELVLSPLLYLGAALLYVDQAARVGSRGSAGLHPPVDAESAGRPDAQVES